MPRSVQRQTVLTQARAMARPAASAPAHGVPLRFRSARASRDGARRYSPRTPRSIRAPAGGRPRNGTGCRRWRGRCGTPGCRRPRCWPAARRARAAKTCRRATGRSGRFLGNAPSTASAARRFGQLDAVPAELAGAADLVRSAEGAGDDLAAEADAEHGAVLPLEVAQQFEKLREIGIVLVVQRVLAAAEHDRASCASALSGSGSP